MLITWHNCVQKSKTNYYWSFCTVLVQLSLAVYIHRRLMCKYKSDEMSNFYVFHVTFRWELLRIQRNKVTHGRAGIETTGTPAPQSPKLSLRYYISSIVTKTFHEQRIVYSGELDKSDQNWTHVVNTFHHNSWPRRAVWSRAHRFSVSTNRLPSSKGAKETFSNLRKLLRKSFREFTLKRWRIWLR